MTSQADLDGVPRAVELHPEHRDPLVRIRLTPANTGDATAWAFVKPFLKAWLLAGAAYVELDGDVVPPGDVDRIADPVDLHGARLIIVDRTLADDARATFAELGIEPRSRP